MKPTLLLPLTGFLQSLRYPTLFKLTAALMLLSWLWPFDPIPFIDEIITALATLLLARWKRREPVSAELPPPH